MHKNVALLIHLQVGTRVVYVWNISFVNMRYYALMINFCYLLFAHLFHYKNNIFILLLLTNSKFETH